MAGNHIAYALVDVRDEEEERDLVPTFLLNKTRIIEVWTITPELIKSLHGKVA